MSELKKEERPPGPMRRIAIIGGGVSGYALAQLLEHYNRQCANGRPFEVTVYERDKTMDAREQVIRVRERKSLFKFINSSTHHLIDSRVTTWDSTREASKLWTQ